MTYLLYFLLGASLGSFLGLIYDRFPQKSIIWPPSHCFNCQNQLRARDLIPILSWYLNRYKCRYCHTTISPIYSLIETAYGILFILCLSFHFLTYTDLAILSLSLFLSIYDYYSRSYPLLFWLLAYGIGFLVCGIKLLSIFFLLIGLLAVIKPIKIGSGDFFYLALLALFYPLSLILWTIQVACLLGLVYSFWSKQKVLPFIPFLSAALLILLLIT
ncbi:prepilin peptidase [Streptococcus penaeicida]|uniref:prepilin peptidase n=1 Tax=Streptococcus penaeicida TaxID=1765960 RepID=UPI000C99E4CB|nr:A24 family peptidase [Streptococcus penaeicida]